MTDTYGTEPHDHEQGHDDILTHEHEAVREPPSDYEFADEHSATVAEEHNEEHAAVGADTKLSRRSPALPILAAAGGVLLLGAVAWWQFGGSHTPMQQGAINVSAGNQMIASNPAPIAIETPKNDFPNSTVAPTTSSGLTADATSVSPQSMNSSPAPIPSPTPSLPAPASVMVAAPMASSPIATGSSDHKIEVLTTRIDDLQKSLDQTTQQLSQVTNMVSATMSANSATKDLQDRLDKIEQQLSSLHHSTPKLAVPATLPAPVRVVTESTLSMAPKVTSHHTSTALKAPHAASHAAPKAAAETKPPLVLRAASPGQAWVASSVTSADLKQVQPGDTLDGIGKVTAITQVNGNWVVQGTKGTLQ